ncbi:MAG: nucleotidyl transferase AbiEii/AbiGii toxin family protein [Candidatus Rokubacteria bacterium]|nr:nucleotidyl transferase AbiEii/AbiGii toxin family protein [Candidatus Rokubacteria bacterium]
MTSKQPDLVLLARVLTESGIDYALIGGLALQVHQAEPRTTLDIDVAVSSREAIPREALAAAGFAATGSFPYTENWQGPGGTPVQFSDDAAFADAIRRAASIDVANARLRVITVADLVRAKLRSATEPARRASKRLRDLADIQELLEEHPEIAQDLSADERAALHALLPGKSSMPPSAPARRPPASSSP